MKAPVVAALDGVVRLSVTGGHWLDCTSVPAQQIHHIPALTALSIRMPTIITRYDVKTFYVKLAE